MPFRAVQGGKPIFPGGHCSFRISLKFFSTIAVHRRRLPVPSTARASTMGPPNVRTVQGLWGDAEERRAERDSHTIPVHMPTGPLPHPIDFNRPEYQVRRANALTPNASKGLGISPRSPRMHLPPALDIMQRLGPPPMTTVLAGPRSPRRLMPVAQGPPPPGAAAPLSARPSTPRGMQAKVDAFYSKYTTVEKAAKVPSGGVIVRDGSVGAYHRPKTPKGAVSNEELAAAHKLLQNFMETKFKSLRKCPSARLELSTPLGRPVPSLLLAHTECGVAASRSCAPHRRLPQDRLRQLGLLLTSRTQV